MSEPFDPYYRWLSIPPSEQPPNHYRLLGVALFEQNADVIDLAADRQMLQLRQMQSGPHGAASQRLLNEVATARACLVDADRREAYDEVLRREIEKRNQEVAISSTPESEPAQPPPADFAAPESDPLFAPLPAPVFPAPPGPHQSVISNRTRPTIPSEAARLLPIAAVIVALLGVGLIGGIYLLSASLSSNAAADGSNVDASQPIAEAPRGPAPESPTPVVTPPPAEPADSQPAAPLFPTNPSPNPTPTSPDNGPNFFVEAIPGHVLQADEHIVHCLRIGPDGRQLVTGGSEHVIRVWDMQTGRQLVDDIAVSGPVKALAYLGDGKTMVARLLNRTRYSNYDGSESAAYKTAEVDEEGTGLEVSPDGRYLAATDTSGAVILLEAKRPAPGYYPDRSRRNFPSPLFGAAFSPDSSQFAVFGDRSLLVICNVPDCQPQLTIKWPMSTVVAATFSPDGTKLYAVNKAGRMWTWDASSGAKLEERQAAQGAHALLATPDGASLIVAGGDGIVSIWSVPDMKRRLQFEAHPGAVTAAALTHESEQLLTAGADGSVRFWQLRRKASP